MPSQTMQACADCGGAVIDANGVAPLPATKVRARRFALLGSLRTWVTDRISRRRVEARHEEAGALQAIADAPDGLVRVRGRVRIVRPVRAPDGTLVAALRMRRLLDARHSPAPRPSPTRRPMRRWIEEARACGAFLLDDGSGVALIDDDAFDLEALAVDPLPAARDGMLALREGDLAEVIGSARREPAPAELAADPRVGSAPLLCFDGRPDAPLILLPLPLTAVLPVPRAQWFKGKRSSPGGSATREHEALSELEAAGRAEAEARGRITGGD
jgi:hypothetical protein